MCYINNTPERTEVQNCASCSAEEISRRLSVAIKDENLWLANQLLNSLAGLSRSDLIVQAMVETINNEAIEYDSDIYTIVIGAIANYIYLPGLRDVWGNIYSCKTPPITVEELLKGTEFAECERFVSQDDEVEHDGRLDRFLNGFEEFGTAIILVGYSSSGESDSFAFSIQEGKISHEDSRKILSFLDAVGIKEALPEFHGKWLKRYYLKGSAWYSKEEIEDDRTWWFWISKEEIEDDRTWWFWIECLACTDTEMCYD